MTHIQILGILALALAARAWLAGCDFFLGPEAHPLDEPTPYQKWRTKR